MITIISGTNRQSTYIQALEELYLESLQEKGLQTETLHLSDLPREIAFHFPENEADVIPGFETFQAIIDRSSFLIFILPEYNGSMPGILKLFVDACRYPDSFADKGVALAGISSGMFGNLRGLDHLDSVLSYLRAKTMPYRVHLPRIEEKIAPTGEIVADSVRDLIAIQVNEIAKHLVTL